MQSQNGSHRRNDEHKENVEGVCEPKHGSSRKAHHESKPAQEKRAQHPNHQRN